MKTVLVFAGTYEGRELVEAFDRSRIKCHVCVATEYGSQMLKTSDNVIVHTGRLDKEAMVQLMKDINCDIVVDATHPYAVMVTKQIKACIANTDIKYIRLLRENDAYVENENAAFYLSVSECAKELTKCEGKILLTTGSKQLTEFTAKPELKDRLIARVIPGMESFKLCYDAGLEGGQIIAMQGPFSQAMNESVIKEYNIEHLVTKESGITGGVDSKYAAAQKLGVKLHIIKRPDEGDIEEKQGLSIGDTIKLLEEYIGIAFDRGKVSVMLAGIGPGNQDMMTEEVKMAIAKADIVFGAKRMLEAVSTKAVKYSYYLKKDILPVLNKHADERYADLRVVILFSGDTGFFSGSAKMYDALIKETDYEVAILPGISSISLLSAKLGIGWQNSKIISLHGVDKEQWIPRLLDSVRYNEKTFFIASGVDDINTLGTLLEGAEDNYDICIGYQLSYPDEKIMKLTASQCKKLDAPGLYAGVIISKEIANKFLVPVLKDEFFVRDKVPMTKEEIRKISICQMEIKENDIVYDIGSGTGSIAVQTGTLSGSVQVYALECNPDAVSLIKQNVKKAGLNNVKVIETMAPEGLDNLPMANAAFIGGSKGNLKEILLKLHEINSSMRVVINAVSMETICEINKVLDELNICNLTIEQVSVSTAKKLGEYHMLSANNPVFVFAFNFM